MPKAKKIDVWSAAANGKVELVAEWLATGNDPNIRDTDGLPPLHYAAYRGRAEVVSLLLEHGADVNTANHIGFTPLMVTSQEGYSIETVHLLLEAGANVNSATKDGQTALLRAIDKASDMSVIFCLINNGADVKWKTADGYTALMYAAFHGVLDIVRVLIERGSDINAVNERGDSALSIALRKDYQAVADLLLANGALKAHI